jgi:2,3,4,5-tetrahydropyridine-2-carboxylate N-succinyltransferase
VPKNSVVVAGTLPIGKGRCHVACAAVVQQLDAKTRAKVRINELLRQI